MLTDGLQDKAEGGMVDQIVEWRLVFPEVGNYTEVLVRSLEQPDIDAAIDGTHQSAVAVEDCVLAKQHQTAGRGVGNRR